MVKKFSYLCDFAGTKQPVTFYIGDAKFGNHPIAFQSSWLNKQKGGVVPQDLMDSLAKIKEISDLQKIPFEDLCEYVIKEIEVSQKTKANLSKQDNENHIKPDIASPDQLISGKTNEKSNIISK